MNAVAHASGVGQREARIIRVAQEFSATPGGRSPKNGPFSGQLFRESVLLPALRMVPDKFSRVIVDLNGADTYIGSFLEEAFGGLLRGPYSRYSELENKLSVEGSGEFVFFRDLALEYMREQDRQNRNFI